MKKALLSFLILNFTFLIANAQVNLVPNFSFEQYSTCPTTADEVNLSTGWYKCSYNGSTPDYYNACSPSNAMGVPQNYFFYQPDHRGCGAYMGLLTWATLSNEREHIGVQLTQPMIIGQKYFLSFYTVMGGSSASGFYYESPSDNIGARLSTVAYSSSNPAPIDNFTHLRSTTIITDTANWVRISGSIVADSAYRYLMLGNFYDDANTDTTTLNCGNCQNSYSYYLIDDVCISTDSALCNGGIDLLPCNVSVEENNFNNQINIYPNPANSETSIECLLPFNTLIFNILGEQVFYASQSIGKITINTSQWENGMYIAIINNTRKKIIINH
jgi:hypothetical protein